MKQNKHFWERGQTLVIVALSMIALMAMLMLVLDGGNAYYQRRIAQAAADAGALAGARDYCEHESVTSATTTALAYVTNNRATATADDVTVTTGTGEVTVVTHIAFQNFFGGVFGLGDGNVSATATAICSPPSFANAPLPVAWACHPPAIGGGAGEPGMDDMQCDMFVWDRDVQGKYSPDWENPDEKKYYYVVMDSVKSNDDVACVSPPNSMYDVGNDHSCDVSEADWNSGYIDCDLDDDCYDDVMSGGSRGWLDLTGGGGGANELIDFIDGSKPVTLRVHSWLGSKDGNTTSVYSAVKEYAENRDVIIPVFDYFCAKKLTEDPDDPESPNCLIDPEDWVAKEGIGPYFHVNAFALFHITCVRADKDECPVINELLSDNAAYMSSYKDNIISIEGYFVKGFTADLGGLEITGANTDTYIVKLVE